VTSPAARGPVTHSLGGRGKNGDKLLIAETVWHGALGWLSTAASVGALILWSIGLGARRLGRAGDWYHTASAALIILFVAAGGLQAGLLTVAGFAAAFVFRAYGTVMRFRRPKRERRPS
jgi:NhaP-type Na+/H+ or K+/H+ antiporter